jgi:Na+/melibiose symporter-like transporter
MLSNRDFTKRALLLSLAFAWISIFNSVFDALMPLIATTPVSDGGLGLSDLNKGVVMALDNSLALFLLPLFGALSDRSRAKMGKRTPFILFFSASAVVVWVAAGISLGLSANVVFIVLLAVTLSLNAMARPASLALLPDLTPLSSRRKANAITQIVSIVATVVGIALCELKGVGFQYIFYIDSALMAILILIFAVKVRENKLKQEFDAMPEEEKKEDSETETFDFKTNPENLKRNKAIILTAVFFFYVAFNGLVSSLSVYATDVLNLNKGGFTIPQLLCLVAACAAAVPVAKLSKKIQRRHLLILGLDLMIVAFTLAATQSGMTVVMFLSFILAGIGYSVALVNLFPYVLELSDPKQIGKTTGIFNTVMTVAMVLTPIASGALQDAVGRFILFPYCLAALIIATVLLFFIKEKNAK